MRSVKRGDASGSQPLGDRNETAHGSAQWHVGIGIDEITDTTPVGGVHGLDRQASLEDRVVEGRLGPWAKFSCQEVRGLGDDHRSRHQWSRRSLEEFDTG